MAYSKIRKIVILLFCFCSNLFSKDLIDISSKLIKINENKIIFDVFIRNNSTETIYFYPKGLERYIYIKEKKLFIIPNNDEKYGEGFISAHSPRLTGIECIEIKPTNKIKYRFKINQNPNITEKLLNVSNINFSLCIIDKNIKEIISVNEYLYCIKNNLLLNKFYVLESN